MTPHEHRYFGRSTVTYGGKCDTISAHAKAAGIAISTAVYRANKGLPVEQWFVPPEQKMARAGCVHPDKAKARNWQEAHERFRASPAGILTCAKTLGHYGRLRATS